MPRIDLNTILADMGLGQNQGTFLLVPRLRIIVLWALYWGLHFMETIILEIIRLPAFVPKSRHGVPS